MGPWPRTKERELLADAGRRNFRSFVKHVIGIPRTPLGFWWTEDVHGPLCDWLQGEIESWEQARRRRYLMIDAHRGSGKTMLVTKCLSLWLTLRNPEGAVVIDAAALKDATDFASFCRNVLDNSDPNSYWVWLYGNWQGGEWTKDKFTHRARHLNRTEGSYEVSSVETGITGKHPDSLFLDDPVTKDKLREQGNWVRIAKAHQEGCYPALLNHSLFVFTGTPYTDNDPLTAAIRRDGVSLVVGEPLAKDYARYYRADGLWHVYHLPGRKADGTPTLPKAWPEEELTHYQAVNPSDYAAQIMLCPGSGDMVPLTFAQIEECVVTTPEIPRGLPVTIHMDTAFKSTKRMGTGDYSAIILAAHHRALADVYYLEEHGSNAWRDDDFIAKLIEIIKYLYEKKTQIIAMTDEKAIGGKEDVWNKRLLSAFRDENLRMPRFLQVGRPAGDNNTLRIASCAGYWIDGHVKIVRGKCPNLVEQMARIGISEHDDYASAAADAFHPQLYQVYTAGLGRESPVPANTSSGKDPRAAYDKWHKLVKHGPRPPIRASY